MLTAMQHVARSRPAASPSCHRLASFSTNTRSSPLLGLLPDLLSSMPRLPGSQSGQPCVKGGNSAALPLFPLGARMKQLVASRTLVIPDGVNIEVKARKVRVKGARGEWRAVNATGIQDSTELRAGDLPSQAGAMLHACRRSRQAAGALRTAAEASSSVAAPIRTVWQP